MSQASDFKALADQAKTYEMIGRSGAVYVIFYFPADRSVTAARRLPTGTRASARFEFGDVKSALDDCGVDDLEGTTYQKGAVLIDLLENVWTDQR